MAELLNFELGRPNGAKSRRLIVIAWLFTAIIVLMLAFTYYGIGLMSAARAYVGGEGFWSKAQKDMVYALARYARYGNSADYNTYLKASAVNLGDRRARLELEKEHPDLAVARAGFLQGRNHPEDIDGMISMLRDFRRIPDIDKAVAIWVQADTDIDHLITLADKIHAAVRTGQMGEEVMLPHLRELFAINQRLMPLEDAFSSTLGEAARKTQLVLLIVLFAGVSLLMGAAFLISRRLVRQSSDIEDALRHGEQQLRGVLTFAPLPITITRFADQTIVFANDHALRQFKLTAETLPTVRAPEFYAAPGERDKLMAHLRDHRGTEDWEVRMLDAEGAPFWVSMSCKCILYDGQECVLTAMNNIEIRKRNQQELHHRAFHDELTGLPNRAMFMSTLAETFEDKLVRGGKFALMFLDVDRFKTINDELGHGNGDKLLQEVARRLTASVAVSDIVARLGGDEFVILVTDKADAGALGATAARIMDAMRVPVQLDAHQIAVTISMGISCYPRDGADVMVMMRNADLAMYRAKEQGRNNFQWYEDFGTASGQNPHASVRTYHRPEIDA
jgi:diguanylate cyclase (GGDEF)-like protein